CGPLFGALTARHGGDDPARADEAVQPGRGVAQAQNVAAVGGAPGVVQTPPQHPPGQGARRLAVEVAKIVDAAAHGASMAEFAENVGALVSPGARRVSQGAIFGWVAK